MEGFRNFTSAMDRASDTCSVWKNAEDGTSYGYAEMMLMAAYLDRDYPLEERQWYVVFPNGEICLLHEDFDEIMPLWLPVKSRPAREKMTGDEFYPEDDKQNDKGYEYCPQCGKKLPDNAVFCPSCGKKVN